MRFDNMRGHNTYIDNRLLHDTDIERMNGNKIDEKRLKYLIHRGLFFFGIPGLITDHELDIHRIMFRYWNGNMDDFIRKTEFGGRKDVTRNEIESWYEARREDE